MKTKEIILALIRQKGVITSAAVVKQCGISRQAAARHLRELIDERRLTKIGSTRGARYVPYDATQVSVLPKTATFSSKYSLRGLDEASVFSEVELKMGLRKMLSSQAFRIAGYAFTEMLNNAISHSKSKNTDVLFKCRKEGFYFEVRDYGIGVFESIRHKFCLRNHFEAIEHLLKGKQSTDPKHHSGQGIFFTSKIADEFSLVSARQKLVMDNRIQDVILQDIPHVKGTRVIFTLKRKSRKDLRSLFSEYSNSDFEFDKTRITVHLSKKEGEYISRSQARRLLFGLEKFKMIILDFNKVKGVGQGFADEVFRVFLNSYPQIRVKIINTSPSIEFMVKRAKRG